MEADIKFRFEYEGLEFGVTDYEYSPPGFHSYMDPPETEDFRIFKVKVYDSYKKIWLDTPGPILDWLNEKDDFVDEALVSFYIMLSEEKAEREIDSREEPEEGLGWTWTGHK